MNQTALTIKPSYVVAGAVACVLYVTAVAMYFYKREARLRAEAALTAPPVIRQVMIVPEQVLEVTLAFDDGSKLFGTATAKCVGNEPSSDSGGALAKLLRDHTGVAWVPVYGSGKDRKKEWTSTIVNDNGERMLSVRFKIYRKK